MAKLWRVLRRRGGARLQALDAVGFQAWCARIKGLAGFVESPGAGLGRIRAILTRFRGGSVYFVPVVGSVAGCRGFDFGRLIYWHVIGRPTPGGRPPEAGQIVAGYIAPECPGTLI